MRTVILSGELGKLFGRRHQFEVSTPAEAVRALCANFPGFRQHMATAHERNVGYKVITAGEALERPEDTRLPASREIKIVPVVMGAGARTRILIGAAIVAAAFAVDFITAGASAPITSYFKYAGASLILGGVVEMLSPPPKIKGPAERPENAPSYSFNGPVNTTAQGHPVPLAYGRVICGSAIVSAGISVEQVKAGLKRVRTLTTTRVEEYSGYGPLNTSFSEPAAPTIYISRTLIFQMTEGVPAPGNYTPNPILAGPIVAGNTYSFSLTVYDYNYYTYSVVPA